MQKMKPLNVYLVGGAVRDKLLGLPHKEKDWVVVGTTEQEMLDRHFLRVGKDFPVFIHPNSKEEYALARTERKKGKGYYGFECHASPEVTLEEDLRRRDITINAIAESVHGEIIDPYQGQADLKNKIIRHVSDAFMEDPVRILRVARFMARFASLGFKIAEETLELMRAMVENGEVDALVPERVWQEMDRSLQEENPDQFFITLRRCGALKRIWPALDRLWGVPERPEYHPELDTGIHVMLSLQMAVTLSQDPVVRFAVLCHDLGKGATDSKYWPSHRGHEESGVPLIQDFCKFYHVPSEYRALAILVSRYHLHCHRIDELKPSTVLTLLENIDIFRQPKRLDQFLLACEADARGRKGFQDKPYPQANKLRQAADCVKSVNVKPLLDQGFSGALLGEKLKQERILVLKELLRK